MFGLSFGKLLIIIGVVVALWQGVKLLTSLRDTMDQRNKLDAERQRQRAVRPATDLVECPSCGTFIPSGSRCPSCRSAKA